MHSGHGLQAWWLFKEPLDVTDDNFSPESEEKILEEFFNVFGREVNISVNFLKTILSKFLIFVPDR